jgi:hypothetical protein
MLSNANIKVFLKKVPMNCLVVDEASQIEIGNYITTFTEFGATLRKVCFIGDDKQWEYASCPCHSLTDTVQKTVPPYGQEDIEDLQSIFEVTHLNKSEKLIFLDTQCQWWKSPYSFFSQSVYRSHATPDWEIHFQGSV